MNLEDKEDYLFTMKCSLKSERRFYFMYFKGDVIITDPCNIVKSDEDWKLVLADTYDRAELDKIGIQNFLSFETVGESRGFVKNSDTGDTIGEFCTDSCIFCICLLEEVLAYHPEFDDYEKYPGSCAVIRGFEGKIVFKKQEEEISVIGTGNINFHADI